MNIKFKVWDSKEKEFIDKALCMIYLDCDGKLMAFNEKNELVRCPEFAPVFSTGQADKNGVEIYEGDIMPPRIVVSWLDDNNEGLGMNVGWYLQRDDFESWAGMETQLQENTTYEVIGNKYENPELLET